MTASDARMAAFEEVLAVCDACKARYGDLPGVATAYIKSRVKELMAREMAEPDRHEVSA